MNRAWKTGKFQSHGATLGQAQWYTPVSPVTQEAEAEVLPLNHTPSLSLGDSRQGLYLWATSPTLVHISLCICTNISAEIELLGQRGKAFLFLMYLSTHSCFKMVYFTSTKCRMYVGYWEWCDFKSARRWLKGLGQWLLLPVSSSSSTLIAAPKRR